MELRISCEVAHCVATQELPIILWNTKFRYSAPKSPQPAPILSQTNPVRTTLLYLSKINFNVTPHLRLGFSSGLFLSCLPTNVIFSNLLPHSCSFLRPPATI
jgi:hypothetical protein